jgi:hypothetical protein
MANPGFRQASTLGYVLLRLRRVLSVARETLDANYAQGFVAATASWFGCTQNCSGAPKLAKATLAKISYAFGV